MQSSVLFYQWEVSIGGSVAITRTLGVSSTGFLHTGQRWQSWILVSFLDVTWCTLTSYGVFKIFFGIFSPHFGHTAAFRVQSSISSYRLNFDTSGMKRRDFLKTVGMPVLSGISLFSLVSAGEVKPSACLDVPKELPKKAPDWVLELAKFWEECYGESLAEAHRREGLALGYKD